MSGAPTMVLFDAPGPRAVVRHRVAAVIGGLVILGILALLVRGLANPANNQFTAAKWLPLVSPTTWTAYLLPGLGRTLLAAAIAVVLSVVLGLLLGMGRMSTLTPVRIACGVFVEFFRSVPVLMMMLFGYYLGLFVFHIFGSAGALFGVVVGLTFYNSSVIAELIRSGINALPKGQREAGLALGLTNGQTMTTILLPQAVTAMLPSLISQLVVILKDTALGTWITYSELLQSAQNFAVTRGNLIPTFMVVAVVYIVLNYLLSYLARRVERGLQARRDVANVLPAEPLEQVPPGDVAKVG